MNRTSIRKFITAIAMKYIVSNCDRNNTLKEPHIVVITENDYTLTIDRNCYMPVNYNDTYLEDYRIDFDGIINNKNIKSLFYIEWKNEMEFE